MKKNSLITIITIISVILIAILIIQPRGEKTSDETAKCIGENSVLYVQLGCHACEIQENMFGNNSVYLNVIDCFYEKEKCTGITATPTWKIDNELYKGVQTIEELKKLTGC